MQGVDTDDEFESLITPETFIEVANRLHKKDPVHEGVTEDGFITRGIKYTFVGHREAPDTCIIGRMRGKTETVGRSNPRLQTRENEYVEVELRRVELPSTEYDSFDHDSLKPLFDDGEKIDTGYVNGYRVEPISDVIESVFKWHNLDI
jgi:hypothetical protein